MLNLSDRSWDSVGNVCVVIQRIEDRRVIGVDRFDFGVEGHGGFAALADGDAAADAGPQFVEYGDLLHRFVPRPARFSQLSGATSLNRAPSRLGWARLSVTVPKRPRFALHIPVA